MRRSGSSPWVLAMAALAVSGLAACSGEDSGVTALPPVSTTTPETTTSSPST